MFSHLDLVSVYLSVSVALCWKTKCTSSTVCFSTSENQSVVSLAKRPSSQFVFCLSPQSDFVAPMLHFKCAVLCLSAFNYGLIQPALPQPYPFGCVLYKYSNKANLCCTWGRWWGAPTKQTWAGRYLEEGISAGYLTISGAAGTSVGQCLGREAGGRCCWGPMTAAWPSFQ